jgi:uncharacterized membrane protein
MADTGKKIVSGARKTGQVVAKQSTPATVILFLALVTGIIGRWAHGKSLPTGTGLIQIVFALVVITVMDRGQTRPIARGLAYLFLAAVLLGPDSPLAVLNKQLPTKPKPPKAGPPKGK